MWAFRLHVLLRYHSLTYASLTVSATTLTAGHIAYSVFLSLEAMLGAAHSVAALADKAVEGAGGGGGGGGFGDGGSAGVQMDALMEQEMAVAAAGGGGGGGGGGTRGGGDTPIAGDGTKPIQLNPTSYQLAGKLNRTPPDILSTGS